MDVSEIAARLREVADCEFTEAVRKADLGAILDDRERLERERDEKQHDYELADEAAKRLGAKWKAGQSRITQLEQELATAREAFRVAAKFPTSAAEVARAFLTKDTPND